MQAALGHQTPDPTRSRALLSEAISHLEHVVSPDRRDPLSELTLGQLYVETENYPKGITTLQLFLLDQPGYPEAMMLLAEAYDESGRLAEAIDLVEEVVEDQPAQLQTRAWLADLYEKSGRWKDAATTWADLATRSPRNAQAYRLRQATALVNAGDVDGGRAQLVALTKATPRDISLWYLLSQVERRTGNPQGAEDAAKQIAQIDPNDARGPLALAESQAARGDHAGVDRDAPAARRRARPMPT